ncbi:ribbon-helix-helix domain-containing protein [Devosia sp. FKR38]|uniref:ribbon-helix-helix domain-containing protein n=1 Tax=Devosia sp. FKR38 TaxID=2562312 RepID=UPI0010BFB39D|nr:ribbon-helix-helix domain-containing protein [Devosia sp. FKR38]
MDKRSLSIAGHRTSIALEPEFWAALEQMAAQSGQTMTALICAIDAERQTANLSSAARLAVLAWYQRQLAAGGTPPIS